MDHKSLWHFTFDGTFGGGRKESGDDEQQREQRGYRHPDRHLATLAMSCKKEKRDLCSLHAQNVVENVGCYCSRPSTRHRNIIHHGPPT